MKGMRVPIGGMSDLVHVLMVGKIGQGHDLLEVEVIGRTVMMMVDMREVRGEGIVMINVKMTTFPWYA